MMGFVLMVAGSAVWSNANDDQAKKDLIASQGHWVIVSFTVNGKEQPADSYKNLKLQIKRDKYIIRQGAETASRTLKLDANANPKAMDITYDDGPNKGKTNRAIYALEGEVLTICRQQHPELDRPKEFTANAGSERALIKWKKVK